MQHLPALLKVIANKWVINIPESPFGDVFHGLEEKRLVLGVNILDTLQQKALNWLKYANEVMYIKQTEKQTWKPLNHGPYCEQYSEGHDYHTNHQFSCQHLLV